MNGGLTKGRDKEMDDELFNSRETRTLELRRRYEEERLILRTAEVVAKVMKEAGLTRATLAQALNTSQGNVTQFLSGSRNMTLRSLAALAHACGRRAEVRLEFLSGEENPWSRQSQLERLAEAMSRATSLLDGFQTSSKDARGQGAFHLGEAGGIAFDAFLPGVESDALFKDISDAVENWNIAKVRRLHRHATALAASARGSGDDAARAASGNEGHPWECSWLQCEVAVIEARDALEARDSHRLALMSGFVAGMMWCFPGPYYDSRSFRHWVQATREYPDSDIDVPPDAEYRGGTILDTVLDGYFEHRLELLQWAEALLRRADKWNGGYPSELEDRSVRYAQNFGLRIARGGDDSVRVPPQL